MGATVLLLLKPIEQAMKMGGGGGGGGRRPSSNMTTTMTQGDSGTTLEEALAEEKW